MKMVSSVLPVLFLLGAAPTAGAPADHFRYVSPRPGAQLVAKETTIILRPETLQVGGLAAFPSIEVQGSLSGSHAGEWTRAERGETFIFRPHEAFAPGETVLVTGVGGDREPDDFSFHFTISPKTTSLERSRIEPCGAYQDDAAAVGSGLDLPTAPAPRGGFVLPEGFPPFTVKINDNPAPGYVFVAPRPTSSNTPPHFAIMLDNTGSPAFLRQLPYRPADFKKQKNGDVYSYLQYGLNEFHVVNESFEFLDSFGPENGYPILDGHDFQVLPNGNVFIAIIDLQVVDMSEIVPGGDPNATVHGFVMQEQDPSHNVVFQWRSWDHFEITEATGIDFTWSFIDYVHFNAFDLDTDGNILISCREMNEITKIDRQTGDILWRMGGSQNEFTLVGDTQWFERQHSVRRTPTGTVTIFDNSALQAPWESRAVEYDLDEVNKIATLVWEFRDDPPVFAGWGSNVQRLPNGNTLIGWAPPGIITEVRSDGTKAFEMVIDDYWTYRAFRFEWDGVAARPELWYEATPSQVTLHFARFGDPDVPLFHIYRGTSPGPTTRVGSTPDNSFVLDVRPSETLFVRVTAADSAGGNESPFSNELHIFIPDVVEAPIIGNVTERISLYQNHPNPFVPSTTISFALPERGPVDLAIYDVRGRLVRRLIHGEAVPGRNDVMWNGTDARGRPVGSGVYFYRLSAGDQEMTKRMSLVR
jgi:hypothetical protein